MGGMGVNRVLEGSPENVKVVKGPLQFGEGPSNDIK